MVMVTVKRSDVQIFIRSSYSEKIFYEKKGSWKIFTILLFYYLVKIKWVKIYQCTCVYIGIVHLCIKSDFYHLAFFIPFYHPELGYDDS